MKLNKLTNADSDILNNKEEVLEKIKMTL